MQSLLIITFFSDLGSLNLVQTRDSSLQLLSLHMNPAFVSPHAVQCLVLRVALLANILILTTPMLSVHMVPEIECDIISEIIYKQGTDATDLMLVSWSLV